MPDPPVRRILHFVDHLGLGGAEHALVQMATRVDRSRFATAVGCFEQSAFGDALAAAGVPLHVLPKRRAFDLRLLWDMVRLLRRERSDLLHCHDLQSAAYGAIAGLLARVPALFTVQGEVVFKQPRTPRLLPWIGRLHRRIVFVADWLRQRALRDFRVPPAKALLIHNAADLSAFVPGEPDPALARSLGLEPGDLVVGAVGNLRPVKDHATLLRAFARVAARVPQARLVIVGEGDERPRLEALAAELGIAGSVKLLGQRADVPLLLRRFDVFVLSSISEGLSLSIVEAMAVARPVVATRVGGNPEIVRDGETGLLVPSGDPPALAEALVALLDDPARRDAFGAAGLRRAQSVFSLPGMIEQYERLYETLIPRPRGC